MSETLSETLATHKISIFELADVIKHAFAKLWDIDLNKTVLIDADGVHCFTYSVTSIEVNASSFDPLNPTVTATIQDVEDYKYSIILDVERKKAWTAFDETKEIDFPKGATLFEINNKMPSEDELEPCHVCGGAEEDVLNCIACEGSGVATSAPKLLTNEEIDPSHGLAIYCGIVSRRAVLQVRGEGELCCECGMDTKDTQFVDNHMHI